MPDRPEYDRCNGDDDRHQCDVEEFEPEFQLLDIAAQCGLHVAQLAAGLEDRRAELLDRLGLFGREGGGSRRVVLAGQARELALGVLELVLQAALLGAVARLGRALDAVDDLERPGRGAAAAQADQIFAAGQHVDRIGDEIAVVRDRHDDPLAEEILALHPDPVIEDVGVGDDDNVDRLRRLLERRWFRGRCGARRRAFPRPP